MKHLEAGVDASVAWLNVGLMLWGDSLLFPIESRNDAIRESGGELIEARPLMDPRLACVDPGGAIGA